VNPFWLEGKVCVITGAAGLLGKEHCKALNAAGGQVVPVDVTEADGGVLGADITDPASLIRLRDTILSRYGRIDVLVNNAAINDKFESPEAAAELSRFEAYPLALWKRSLDVNVTGTFLASQILGTEMAKRRSGSIINVASTYGLVGPDQKLYRRPDGTQTFHKSAAYPTTKGAVIAFTRFLAAYWGEAGVRVNALSPGGVENGQEPWFIEAYGARTPLGRMATKEDYNGAIVFLACDASRYMTGANLVVDGGFTAW
jgi:NAD(P)-dependent dehydrogenase (short-subunit alcohol dehydrogenase family)